MNEEGAVLAVQERSGPLKGTGIWKIPTGLLDKGEDIPDGAIREVLEETVNLDLLYNAISSFLGCEMYV